MKKYIINQFSLLVAFCLLVGVITTGCKNGNEPKLTPEQILKEKLIGEWQEVEYWRSGNFDTIYYQATSRSVIFTEDTVFYYLVEKDYEPVGPEDIYVIKMGYQVITADSILLFKDDWYINWVQSHKVTKHKITFYKPDSILISNFIPTRLTVPYPDNHDDILLIKK